MTSAWMMTTIVGWLPLMEVVFRGSIIIVMIVDSFSKLPIPKSDAS